MIPTAGYDLTYTLTGDDADSFNIVETSGELQTKSPLNREVKDTYTVTVWVSDGLDATTTPTPRWTTPSP